MKVKRTGSSFQAMNTTRKLESIFLFVTGRCNSKCAMCFYADDMAKRERDLTFDEISKATHKPLGTILWKYNSAIKKLRKELEDEYS